VKKRSWPVQFIVGYALLQIPSLALLLFILMMIRHWAKLPAWSLGVIVALWVAKDVARFPFIWHSYNQNRPSNPSSIIGARGIAEEPLDPSGYVRVHDELWKAEVIGGSPVNKGDVVHVEDVKGIKLLVRRVNE
jgi:membrane protein implicated in regulation of membrane protease activity